MSIGEFDDANYRGTARALRSRKFPCEQRRRGGINRARKCRASRRAVKTELLALMESGCSQREAARRVGLPESTARGILRNTEIIPIVPNLHSRKVVPRAMDRHHAARQRCLTAKRVAALYTLYREPRESRDVRIKTKPYRPCRPIVPGQFGALRDKYRTIEILSMHTVATGEWCGRPGTWERLIVDARAPEFDYRIHGFTGGSASVRSADCYRSVLRYEQEMRR